jgi:predicted RNA-binding protein Jag
LVRIVVHRVTGERCSVLVDVRTHRKRRGLRSCSARDAAERVKKSGRRRRWADERVQRKLCTMPSRRSAASRPSEGEDPERRVVIQRGG